jgi:hypothetical protein
MNATLTPPGPPAFASLTGLQPFDPRQALSLEAACRLGLVPGRSGRRLTTDELLRWATEGYSVVEGGPRYLFPTVVDELGCRITTADWCAAWVTFLGELSEALAEAGRGPLDPPPYKVRDVL